MRFSRLLGGAAPVAWAALCALMYAAAGHAQYVTINPAVLPVGVIGQPYTAQLTASGVTGPYSFCVDPDSALPPGLTLSVNGSLSGTITQPPLGTNQFNFVVDVEGSCSAETQFFGSATITLPVTSAVNIQITPATLNPIDVGQPLSYPFSATSPASITWSLQGAPSWLSINPNTGTLTGTPTAAGPYSFTVVASSGPSSSGLPVGLTVYPAVTISSGNLPLGTLNKPYSAQINYSGGSGVYSVSASGLPPGLNIANNGAISGTPSTTGSFPFAVTVKDSTGASVTGNYSVTVNAPLTITTKSIPPGNIGVAYSQAIGVSGGSGGYTWSATGLPSWLTISSGGQLSGMPVAAGLFSFEVVVKDSSANSANAVLTLQVTTELTITTSSLPAGSLGISYSAPLSATGATGTVTWSIVSGGLPPGLSLSPAGAIAGTPTQAGDFAFTVQAIDATNTPVRATLTIHIPQPPVSTISAAISSVLTPGTQPSVNITLSPAYPLPITVTAMLSISPDVNGGTDLGFTNGTRSIQFTIPANTSQYQLPFSTGTSAGAITITLNVDTTGQSITVSGSLTLNTQVPAQAPSIGNVTAAMSTNGSTLTVVVTGFSSTRDMKTALFHFIPAAGASLSSTDFTVDVSPVFAAWYTNSASFPTGSQFKLTMPFTIVGSAGTISSVTVMLTNSNSTSQPVTATVH